MSESEPARLSPTSYDDVPYESSSFPQTHPDRLATLASLFGLSPAPVERCRVLELGCAMGANLIPMAFHLPGSDFVGVDLSARQVTAAREYAAELGLTNVRFEHASIMDVDADWGEFDYLICHGVYSWVSDSVQDRIFTIAARNLAPHGIAFVSYNTYPGWHMREMVRHMMRYHAAQFEDIPERIEQARALIDFLAGNVDTTSYYGALLQDELKLVHRARDSYLYHEHLEEVNSPVYFHEFVSRASGHDLRYLADAEFSTMLASGFGAETAETLARISTDIVRAEQYMDFLRNRFFRQTLLCHSHQQVRRQLEGPNLAGLLLSSSVQPDHAAEGEMPGFRTPDGRRVATAFPLTHAALHVLSQHWPCALDQATLRTLATEQLAPATDSAQIEQQWAVVMEDLLHCYASGAIQLHTWQAPCVPHVTATPQVSRLVAHQARTGNLVVNQRHEAVTLDVVGRHIAAALDGTRSHDILLTELTDKAMSGALLLEENGRPVHDGTQMRETLEIALESTLRSFARQSLLLA